MQEYFTEKHQNVEVMDSLFLKVFHERFNLSFSLTDTAKRVAAVELITQSEEAQIFIRLSNYS
ncbi:hypothetical protein PR048_013096 [Dryococelus australis]|uniref:Uncharacterized protein n=1 Tax=Dryococelus australis TaxID=614101 RepID=A0ABQ9HS06_9NEOP|nr:hypothetical protein PR048_013096 [Dryococelus australis]